MKRLKYYFLLPLSMLLLIVSCTKSSDDSDEESGNWIKRSDFEGNARTEAVSFVIGDTAYIGTGFDGTNRYTDFWAYDAEKNFWVQRAQFLGKARNSAVGFTIGNKGYIATGYDGVNRLKDNWEYDPTSNTWIQKADFGGTARYDAVGFGINNKGYITTGFDGGYTKDFWEFTPTGGPNNLGVWTQLISLGGTKRSGSVAWVHNNKAYIVGGINNGAAINEFWVYDPVATSWQELRKISNVSDESYDDDYSDILRYNAVGFVLNNKGYLSTGENGSYTIKSWEYDFVNDLWTRKTSYERAERSGAIAFAVKGKAFIACGRNNSYYFDNLDEFQPNVTYNSND